MWKNRLFAGAVFATVLAASAVLAATAAATPSKQASAGYGQARLHHQVPGGLLLHPRERRQEVGQGDPGREGDLRPGKSGTDDAGEIAAIQNMVAQGVKGIAITPTSAAGVLRSRQGDQAGHQGRPDRQRHPVVEEARASVVATNNFKGGVLAGKFLATKLKAGDTLGILEGVPGDPALDARVSGMLAGLGAMRSKIKVVSKLRTDCDQTKGATAAQTMLTANQNLTAIYCACGPPTLGAIQSIKNAGIKPGGIILVGFDASPDEITAIKAGTETGQRGAVPGQDGLARHRDALQRGEGQDGAEERRHRHSTRDEGQRREVRLARRHEDVISS